MVSVRPRMAYYTIMDLGDRDRRVVAHVARFKQLTSAHIAALCFDGLASSTPLDRSLTRLVSSSYLTRVERRHVGGSRGGSGQYVYALGRRGFFLHYEGHYTPARVVNHHTLAVADVFVTLLGLHRAGRLELRGYTTEPECHVHIDRYDLRPDLYADTSAGKLWLEIDMATQGQRQIKEKFERYWSAYQQANSQEWQEWPRTVFVAVDAERNKELRWLLAQGPADAQPLFAIVTGPEGLAALLGGQSYAQD